jgi:rhodanese-related sulfurtransferase
MKMKKSIAMMMVAMLLIGCTSCEAKNDPVDENPDALTPQIPGAMSPQRALEYMKTTDNLIIVDVASKSNFERKHFAGAINIPIENLTEQEERELYLGIPAGHPVILHCRLGMIVPGAYRTLKELRSDIPAICYIDGTPLFDEYNEWYDSHKDNGSMEGERFLGGLAPTDALEYMKATPDLYIIDVRENEWYEGYTQFEGNVHIPRSQLPSRYTEIPTDRPVILNCGAGVQAPRAYEFLREKNADIRQLSYIAGTPLFSTYNNWLKKQKK